MSSPFAAPATAGETFKPKDAKGHLLILKPLDYRTGITTTFGDSDAISVNVVDLDDHDPTTAEVGRVYLGALWFSGVLVGSLKSQIGSVILARMGQGTAKAGQSAPWILEDATQDPAAVARATEWMRGHPGALDGLTSPAPSPAPVAVTQPPAPPVTAPASNTPPPGVTPEAWALIQQMQATGQLPQAG
jgi:hypothetical protein